MMKQFFTVKSQHPEALLLLWEVLETFHYPSAGMVRESIERRISEQRVEPQPISDGGEVIV